MKGTFGYRKACVKKINGVRVYLYKAWDVVHGYGWHCHGVDDQWRLRYGFSKNKFSAVRIVLHF